jgi:lipopolysaccharide export system permease protein
VKEGQFTSLDNGITFHFRERSGSGVLLGIFMQDRRERDSPTVYLAERGQTFDLKGQSYLVLEQGSVHRQQPKSRDSSIIAFERYAIDLAAFNQDGGETVYKPRERGTTQLLFPKEDDAYYRMQSGRFRAELHERFSGWLYPLAMMLIAFAALGDARTTRQGRGLAVVTAVVAVIVLRIAGFAASSAAVRSPTGVVWIYAAPLAAVVIAGVIALEGPRARTYGTRAARAVAAAIQRLTPAQLRLRRA